MKGFNLGQIASFSAGLAVLAGFQWLGNIITEALQLPMPGAVTGLLLLFATLAITGDAPSWLAQTCYRLISLLSLFFIPAGVGIFFLGDIFADNWLAIIAAILLATPISIVVTALIMQFLLRRFAK